ncbi:MAG: hypothetical protein JHC95_22035, partial [Solirubrobacteraceae bacterium]|nr:hypothetical protein [Solirubrobacteraceae bacterium]
DPMPERVVSLANEVSDLATDKLRAIERVANQTQMLALNARIQAAHAGERGAAFSVVSEEVGQVAGHVKELSEGLSDELRPRISQLDQLGRALTLAVPGQRATDLALYAVELIDRNLYERTCDVRWWATDSAVVDVCTDPTAEGAVPHACHRLGVILSSYTVYLDLWVADRNGRVIAHGRPDRYRGVIGSDVSNERWFQQAMATRSGEDFAVDDIMRLQHLDNESVATYATAIRAGAENHGQAIGALGIFFDWGPQAQGIVEGLRFNDDERSRTRAMLLDANHRVIASTGNEGLLTERFPLKEDGREGGYYTDGNKIIGFHRTPGYETYEGLGWLGCIVQERAAPQD